MKRNNGFWNAMRQLNEAFCNHCGVEYSTVETSEANIKNIVGDARLYIEIHGDEHGGFTYSCYANDTHEYLVTTKDGEGLIQILNRKIVNRQEAHDATIR